MMSRFSASSYPTSSSLPMSVIVKAHLQCCCDHLMTRRSAHMGLINIRCLPAKSLCLAERDGLSQRPVQSSWTVCSSLTD